VLRGGGIKSIYVWQVVAMIGGYVGWPFPSFLAGAVVLPGAVPNEPGESAI